MPSSQLPPTQPALCLRLSLSPKPCSSTTLVLCFISGNLIKKKILKQTEVSVRMEAVHQGLGRERDFSALLVIQEEPFAVDASS